MEDLPSLKILAIPDPILKAKCEPCILSEETIKLANRMVRFMVEDETIKHTTVGLAAPQIGSAIQLFVMRPTPNHQIHECRIVMNPRIVKHGKDKSIMVESCLSVPKQSNVKERYNIIEVEYDTPTGVVRETMKYYLARIFQHEYDHLQGILIGD